MVLWNASALPSSVAPDVRSPTTRDDWDEYVAWANLPQLREVISLDGMLCPDVIGELETQDWDYNVHEDYHIFFFRDFEYLRARVQNFARRQRHRSRQA